MTGPDRIRYRGRATQVVYRSAQHIDTNCHQRGRVFVARLIVLHHLMDTTECPNEGGNHQGFAAPIGAVKFSPPRFAAAQVRAQGCRVPAKNPMPWMKGQ
jgi:hypothetical protein